LLYLISCLLVIRYHLRLFSSFSSHVDHLDLHSFPTRRSSDLCSAFCRSTLKTCSWIPRLGVRHAYWIAPNRGGRLSDVHWPPTRSEEHTSELQSRVDLVCRLLLEKKKTRTHHLHVT